MKGYEGLLGGLGGEYVPEGKGATFQALGEVTFDLVLQRVTELVYRQKMHHHHPHHPHRDMDVDQGSGTFLMGEP